MSDIKSKVLALKSRAHNIDESPWKLIQDELLRNINFDYLCRLTDHKAGPLSRISKFYKDIICGLIQIRPTNPTTYIEILSEPLWFNKTITIDRQSIFWPSWYAHDIKFIKDLLHNDGTFLTIDELKLNYNISCNFLDHLKIRQSIPGAWREMLSNQTKIRGTF